MNRKQISLMLSLLSFAACGSAVTVDDAATLRDAGMVENKVDASQDAGGPVMTASLARYPDNVVQSPLPKVVVDRLRALSAIGVQNGLQLNVATKAGDGNSDHDFFLGCFSAANHPPFGKHTELLATRDYFQASFGNYAANGTNLCLATDDTDGQHGGTLEWVDSGNPPLYAQEIARTKAMFIPELFGMLDMGGDRGNGTADNVREYTWRKIHQDTVAYTDGVISLGAIPLLTSYLGYTTDSPETNATQTMNQIKRSIAQTRQIPFIDFFLAAQPAPAHGTSAGGVHFSAWKSSLALDDLCALTDEAQSGGMNIHNLIVLQALDRMKKTLVDGVDSLDPDQSAIVGKGTLTDPYQVPALPFADAGDITKAPSNTLSDYTACGGGQETGGELVYQFTTAQTIAVRALVLGDKGFDGCDWPTCSNLKDYGLHVFKAGTAMSDCIKTNNTMIEGTLGPGTWYFVVDHYAGVPKSNDFIFTLMACHDGDAMCATVF
jgi:hypothetical protein